MKNQVLSIEQMQRLKELGVDIQPTGTCLMYTSDSSDKYYLKYGESTCEDDVKAFTLQDIIELLPKKIRDFELNWYMHNMIIRYDYYNSFDGIDVLSGSSFGFCDNNSFLESAYEMLIWVAENGYLKTK